MITDSRLGPSASLRRRLLRYLGIVLLTLGLLGMHVLSQDHAVMSGRSTGATTAATTTTATAMSASSSGGGHDGPAAARSSGPRLTLITLPACPGGCGQHVPIWSTCLLLLLTWLVFTRRGRRSTFRLPPSVRLTRCGASLGRHVPCLTLVELSLRRV